MKKTKFGYVSLGVLMLGISFITLLPKVKADSIPSYLNQSIQSVVTPYNNAFMTLPMQGYDFYPTSVSVIVQTQPGYSYYVGPEIQVCNAYNCNDSYSHLYIPYVNSDCTDVDRLQVGSSKTYLTFAPGSWLDLYTNTCYPAGTLHITAGVRWRLYLDFLGRGDGATVYGGTDAVSTGCELMYPDGSNWIDCSPVTNMYFAFNGVGSSNGPTPPTVTLIGDATTTVEYGSTYNDLGATSTDPTDGDITNKIAVTGTVDTHHIGTSTLTYSVTDSVGLSASTTRRVVVQCTQNCYDNIMFLPGIEASRLYGTGDVKLWEPSSSSDAQQLIMNNDGTSQRADIVTKDAIDKAYVPALGNVYSDFLQEMQNWQTQYGITATTTPYDWRLDFDTLLSKGRKLPDGSISYIDAPEAGHDPYIIETLKQLAATSKTGKVTIIAHSMGGLVAKDLMAKMGDASTSAYIDKVILVASPQAGTPEALAGLLHGTDQGLPNSLPLLDYGLTPQVARQLGNNMPSAYTLLPSARYFTQVNEPVATFDPVTLPDYVQRYGTSVVHSQDRQDAFLDDTYQHVASTSDDLKHPALANASLITEAEQLHQTIDNWAPPAGVQVIQIAGWGIPTTIKGMDYSSTTPSQFCAYSNFTICEQGFTATASTTLDGDGTVVVPSALWVGATTNATNYWLNLESYNKNPSSWPANIFGALPYNHASIFQVTPLQTFLQDTVMGVAYSRDTYGNYITLTSPENTATSTRLRYALRSPLTLNLYDNQGRHTGISTTTGMIDQQIPGTYYTEVAGVKYLYTDASSNAHIVMNGYDTGTFTFSVEQLQGDTPETFTTFKDIPATPHTKATMDVQSDITSLSPFHVDENGDGTIINLTPKIGGVVEYHPLTVTADNKTMTLGSALPTFTATITGYATDTPNDVTGSASCTTTATASSSVGTYPVTCTVGMLHSANYQFTTFVAGTLTIQYRWDGFLQPINDTGHQQGSASVFKANQTVPVKFQLKKADGTIVQSSTAPTWLAPQKGGTMSSPVNESDFAGSADTGNAFSWQSHHYQYNWSTKGLQSGYWYQISARLDDGTTQSVIVGLR